ncbi:MAG: hypothetical protein AAFU64_17760, partial [Bacteroidota bacterium]
EIYSDRLIPVDKIPINARDRLGHRAFFLINCLNVIPLGDEIKRGGISKGIREPDFSKARVDAY